MCVRGGLSVWVCAIGYFVMRLIGEACSWPGGLDGAGLETIIIMSGLRAGAGRDLATLTMCLCSLRGLSNNQLTSLPSGIFDKLSSLVFLYVLQ